MLDRLHKKFYDVLVQPILKHYLKKPHNFIYNDLKLKIHPGVFHPKFFFSTQVFAEFIQKLDLTGKKVCEVGAGSGLLSFIAYSKGAAVYSFDINPIAIDGLKENVKSNFKSSENFNLYLSDLFDAIPENKFDIILINPAFPDPNNTKVIIQNNKTQTSPSTLPETSAIISNNTSVMKSSITTSIGFHDNETSSRDSSK
jgi:release factor glutamine methyltransferase